jgi:hypothetical protein
LVNVNLSNSKLSFVKFFNAETAISIEGTCTDTLHINAFKISNSSVYNSAFSSRMKFNKGEISNSDFKNDYGANNSTIIVDSTKISNSNFSSITSNTNVFGMYIKNSEVKGTRFVCGGSALNNARIELNKLICSNCTLSTIYGKCIINDSKIINSMFSNKYSTQLCQVYFNVNRSIIVNTSVESSVTNSNNQWWSEINFDKCLIKKNASTLIGYQVGNINNSSIIGDGFANGINILRGNFSNSTIIDNQIGVVRETDALTYSITNSNLFRNSEFNFQNKSDLDIIATNNFWGATTANLINESIKDYNDDINLGLLDISNFNSSPNTNCPISTPFNFTSINSIGGVNLTWDPNLEGDVAGYKLHYGEFDGFNFQNSIDLGNITSYFLDDNLISDTIAITAYDYFKTGLNDMIEGNESWYNIKIGMHTGIGKDKISEIDFLAYPNPTTDKIKIISTEKHISYSLNDVLGCELIRGESDLNNFEFDLSVYNSGVYILNIIRENKQKQIKIIKN